MNSSLDDTRKFGQVSRSAESDKSVESPNTSQSRTYETDNSIGSHINAAKIDSHDDTGMDNNSNSDSTSDIEMEHCPSSTPIDSSTTFSSSNSIETTYKNLSFDANTLVDKLRVLISETLDQVEQCSEEMQQIVDVLRENSMIK